MGIYLNPSNVGYTNLAKNTRIFVDKTNMIAETNALLNSMDKFMCVSRPRRFGKSLAGDMLCAYYSKGCDSKELFSGLNIASSPSFEEHLNKYNVIQIDIWGEHTSRSDEHVVDRINRRLKKEFIKEFKDIDFTDCHALTDLIEEVYSSTGEKFVILIDEYDCLVRAEGIDDGYFNKYLFFLCSLFKNRALSNAISLAYITGILPIVRERMESKLNEFKEYTILKPGVFAKYFGFVESEVRDICNDFSMDFDECKRWYDGYHVAEGVELYNPRSVVNAMTDRSYAPYWSMTGTFLTVKDFILMNLDGTRDDVVRMIGGGRVDVVTSDFTNTLKSFNSKDDVFTYLIHLGYLAYDVKSKQCYIPNQEVRSDWVSAIRLNPNYANVMELINDSKNLVAKTIEGDAEYVANALDKAHSRATNPLTYNDEASFQSAIGLAYFYATAYYTVIKELPSGKGYADVAFIPYVPNMPAMVVELKCGKGASVALQQIREKKYAEALDNYKGNLLFVGISYDPKTKAHECQIEKMDL